MDFLFLSYYVICIRIKFMRISLCNRLMTRYVHSSIIDYVDYSEKVEEIVRMASELDNTLSSDEHNSSHTETSYE